MVRRWKTPTETGTPRSRGRFPETLARRRCSALARRLHEFHEIAPAVIGVRWPRSGGYLKLRRLTDDILTKIRYLNQIALSVRDGLLDEEGANAGDRAH